MISENTEFDGGGAALVLFESGDLAGAEQGFLRALAQNGAAIKSLRGLAQIAVAGRDAANASACWSILRRVLPDDPWTGHGLGVALLQMDRLPEARAVFESLTVAFPNFLAAWRGLAQAERGAGNHAKARDHLEKALSLKPDHFQTQADLIRQSLYLGDFAQARRSFGALRAGEFTSPDIDRLGAEIAAAEAVAASPEDRRARCEGAHLLRERGRLDEATKVFDLILDEDPNDFHALRGLAQIASTRDDRTAALTLFEKAAAVQPDDLWMQWEIGALLTREGRATEARLRFTKILGVDAKFVAAYRSLAAMVKLAGDSEGALRVLQEALSPCSDNAWLRFDLAQIHKERRDYDLAWAAFEDLLQAPECGGAAALELFYLAKARGRGAAAAGYLRQGLDLSPHHPGLLIAMAGELLGEGRLEKADRIYDALADEPASAYWRLIGKGNVVRRQGRSDEAREFFRKAIDADPTRMNAYAELCNAAITETDRESARGLLDRWAERAPAAKEPRLMKARLARQGKDYEGAAKILRDLVASFGDDAALSVEAAEAEERAGNVAAANLLFDRTMEIAPDDPVVLETLARRAEWRDDLDEALALLQRAIEVDPSRIWLKTACARIQFALGRTAAGFAALDAWRDSCGETPDQCHTRVEMLRQLGRLTEASAASEQACARFRGHFRLLMQGSLLAIELGLFQRAAQLRQQAVPTTAGEQANSLFMQGMESIAKWRLDQGQGQIAAACAINVEDGWALNRLIHCDLLQFDLDSAGRRLRDLARLNHAINRIKGNSVSVSQSHYGQLHDEFRLDPEALAEVREALKAPMEERLSRLRATIRAYPDYTAASIAFLVACRQAGLFDNRAVATEKPIPRRIAQFWDSAELPEDIAGYCRTWSGMDPAFDYRRLDEASALDFLKAIGDAAAFRAFQRAEQPAMKSDILRLAWLLRNGGVYSDADDRLQRSVAPLLESGAGLVLYQEDIGSVGNNFIAAAPDHPVLAAALEQAVAAVNNGGKDLLWLATGPGLLTRCLGRYLAADEGAWLARLSNIRVLDRHEMLSYSAIHCLSAYKHTEKHWSRTAFKRMEKPR
jgi:tetratricopeptide (TPR) repeat protein